MSVECPRCQADVSLRAQFCPRCGTALSAPLDPAHPDAGTYAAWQKARRELLVGWIFFIVGLILLLGALFSFRFGFRTLLIGAAGVTMLVVGLGTLVGDNAKPKRRTKRSPPTGEESP